MPTKQVTIQGIMTWEESQPPVGGGSPPIIWPGPGYPAHPIAPGGPPPTIWPDPGPLPHPEHPIFLPPGSAVPPDVGIWPDPVPPIDVVPPTQTLIAVYVPGVGWRYVMVPVSDLPPGYPPEVPMPKRRR